MSEKAWARWRTAEGALRNGGDVDAAASGLPERQGWILRALAALEAGDRAAFDALLPSAPASDLRAVAELALSEPGSINPTRCRARLKLVGVRNEPFPSLDLLRLMCVVHNRERPTRPQKLSDATYERPALEGALMVLSPSFKAYQILDLLLERSPCLASYWAAGVAQHHAAGAIRDYVRTHMPGAEPLAEKSWPDLDEPIGRRGARASGPSLADFMRDPLAAPWNDACFQQVRSMLTRDKSGERLAALGGLLDAIDALIREAAPAAAIPAVHAAMRLAEGSPEIRQRDDLSNQLQLLDMRLLWSCDEFPHELVEALWSGLGHLPSAQRAHCARLMLRREGLAVLPRAVGAEMLAFAVRGDVDWEQEAQPWILAYGASVDLRKFHTALGDAPEHTRELALGHLHALHRSPAEAYRLAARMIQRGALDDAEEVAMSAFRHESDSPGGRQERRLRHRARLELARAAAASSPPPSALFISGLLSISLVNADQSEAAQIFEPALRSGHERLALAPDADHGDLVPRLQLMSLFKLHDQARKALRDFGHWLRKSAPRVAIPTALRICADFCLDEATVISFGLEGEDQRTVVDDDPRPVWLRSVTAWLDSHDTAIVGGHALALARSGSAPAEHLDLWFNLVSDLGEDDLWDELEELAEPDEENLVARLMNEFGGGFR